MIAFAPHPYPSPSGEGTRRMQLFTLQISSLKSSPFLSPSGEIEGAFSISFHCGGEIEGAPLHQLMRLLNNPHHKHALHMAHIFYLAQFIYMKIIVGIHVLTNYFQHKIKFA